MANSIATPYVASLTAERQKLESLVSDGVKAISLPDQAVEDNNKDKLLEISGWVMGIAGVILVAAGLLKGIDGIWWTGIIAFMSGVYCYLKAGQLGRQSALTAVAATLDGKLAAINAGIASEWNSFVKGQNLGLTRDIISSAAANDSKTAMIEAIGVAPVDIDLDGARKAMAGAAATGKVEAFDKPLADYMTVANDAIAKAGEAQQAIYSAVDAANK